VTIRNDARTWSADFPASRCRLAPTCRAEDVMTNPERYLRQPHRATTAISAVSDWSGSNRASRSAASTRLRHPALALRLDAVAARPERDFVRGSRGLSLYSLSICVSTHSYPWTGARATIHSASFPVVVVPVSSGKRRTSAYSSERSSVGRVGASQALGRGFESRRSLQS
jgi:hypothetical protein